MLKLTAVEGSNKKFYIQIEFQTKEDYQLKDYIKNVVSRREFKAFKTSGFDKWVSQSYFIEETFIPAQFWQDFKKAIQPLVQYELVLINAHILFNNDIKKDEFIEYMQSIVLPPKYNIFAENYEYQLESVYRALLLKCARIEVGTSGGKTLIIWLYCRYLIDNVLKPEDKILIIVPRQLLAKQTQKDFIEYDQFSDKPLIVETIFSGSKRINNAQVVVGVYNSLSDYDSEYFDDFPVILCDEVQGAKSNSIRNGIYAKCRKTDYWFGLTGTYPNKNSLDYLNIVSMFGPLVLIKKARALIDDGNACPVVINKIKINYTEENKDFSINLLKSGFTGGEKYRIEKKFFQTYEPRNKLLAKIINTHNGNHLVLVESVDYCKQLKEFFKEFCPDRYVDIIHGNVTNRDSIIEMMKSRHDMILVATYETMSTGVSINNIVHLHFPDGGRSEIRIKQSTGRVLRIHILKDCAYVWDYQDNMVKSSFKNHAAARNAIYNDEKHITKDYETII